MLIVDSLTCERSGRELFRGLGFCLPPGGFLLLKGENGSGKTSLLRLLAGISAPREGKITWEGAAVADNAAFRRQLTYIGHKNAIKTECTVQENLLFWARHFDTGPMLAPALAYFDLADKAAIPCHTLSAGWQRRVALARLLLSRTKLWLLDEPTNFLDAQAVALLSGLIESRLNAGGTVVVASHAMTSAFDAHILKLEDFSPSPAGGGPGWERVLHRQCRFAPLPTSPLRGEESL